MFPSVGTVGDGEVPSAGVAAGDTTPSGTITDTTVFMTPGDGIHGDRITVTIRDGVIRTGDIAPDGDTTDQIGDIIVRVGVVR